MTNDNSQIPPPGFVPEAHVMTGTNGSDTAPTVPPPPAGFVPESGSTSDELRINPNDGLPIKAGKFVAGVPEGIGEGVFGTLAGGADLMHLPSQTLHHLAGDQNTQHGTAQRLGSGVEDLAEFFLGDAALKGLSVSDRLLKASKIAKTVEESPMLNRIFQVGVRAIRGGAVGTAQGGLKTGDASDALASGLAGATSNALVPGAIDAVKAAPQAISDAARTLRNVIQPGAIQDAFQGQIRAIINDAAKEYGVNPSSASSIRDVAYDMANALQTKAKQAYQAIDDATGGKAQRFRDAIRNLNQKIREINGLDAEQESAYIEKLNDAQDAHDKAMAEAEEHGVPKSLLSEADQTWRKSKAMLDLSKQIRASSEGLRPELATGVKKPIAEKVNTGKLFSRVNRLYDSGRLQDALGSDRADDLLRTTNDSHVASQTAQSWKQLAKTGAKYAAYGTLPLGGYEIVRHLLGE